MYLRIDGLHETALERLAELYGERTAAAVVRALSRQEALRKDVWPTPPAYDDTEPDREPDREPDKEAVHELSL